MKILVTGGAGFIGSAVVRHGIKNGHSIVNVDALTYAACLESLVDINDHPKYVLEHANINDRETMFNLFTIHQPDAVIHLAAESHVDRSIDSPLSFIETNVLGTFNLLEAAKHYWKTMSSPETFRFLHVSTDEVFGSLPIGQKIKFSEDTPYDPKSPYSASKAGSDHLVRAWHETYKFPVLITNCSNNYGPYQFPEKLVPVVILSALACKPISVYGTGHNVRDWLHVDDHVAGLFLVLENGQVGDSYNIGAENEYTNLDLVKLICSILDRLKPGAYGSYDSLITFVADRPGHDKRYAIDPTRIREQLGWTPKVALEEGIEQTALWYLNNKEWWQPLLSRSGVGVRLGVQS